MLWLVLNFVLAVLLLVLLLIAFKALQFYRNRKDALSTALDALKSTSELEVREVDGGHIMFVPTKVVAPATGCVYLPGALVHHHAYAPLCSEIARKSGCMVLLVRARLRIAPFSKDIIAKGIRSNRGTISSWVIGGHSLGGQTAGAMAATWDSSLGEMGGMLGLFLHASYYDTGASLADAPVSVLQVLADCDGIISQEKAAAARKNLPCSTTSIVTISGGNHSGFGHYGVQTFPRPDGERKISHAVQQEQAVRATVDWLGRLAGSADGAASPHKADGAASPQKSPLLRRQSSLQVLTSGLSVALQHESSPLSPGSRMKGQAGKQA